MFFGFVHDKSSGLVNSVVGAVPVNDDAIDAAADHVRDLALDLGRIVGVVSDVHVVGSSKPQHHVGEDFGRSAGVEQRVDVHFADVVGAEISIGLGSKGIGRTAIVYGLRVGSGELR